VYVGTDLEQAPEVFFEAAPEKALTAEQWEQRLGRTTAAALVLNSKQEDGFVKAMLKARPDLAGLPFAMGKKCRTGQEEMTQFKEMAEEAHCRTRTEWINTLHKKAEKDGCLCRAAHTQIAAMKQIKGPSGTGDAELARYLACVPVPEATAELARLAAFSTDHGVRKEAIQSLSVRRPANSAKALSEALRYPWPQVARNAIDAIVKLKRTDLLPQLVDVLEAPDPRAPREEKGEVVASELVRVNHLRSCLLCHAPARVEDTKLDAPLVAQMPVPWHDLPDPSRGYGRPSSNLLVRVDVTYLRQDFSVMQTVKGADPWPEKQRFDFFIRRRVINEAEVADLWKRLEAEKRDGLSPFQHAAYWALRDLTGRDLPPNAEAWRRP
jgi:hypothetical protein